MGDYNINLLNVDSHSLTADFNDTMYSSGLVPLITRPTRVTENSATLIDNMFTNKVVSYDESVYGILVTDISDHYPIFCVDIILKHKTTDLSFVRRDNSEKNKSSFLNDLALMNWQDVYSTTNTQLLFLYSIKKWLIYMTSIFLRNLSQRDIIQESHGCVLVFERQLKRKTNCIINRLKLNVCELRKSMYYTVINYGNWWELRKRNTTLTESWKTNTIEENYGQ